MFLINRGDKLSFHGIVIRTQICTLMTHDDYNLYDIKSYDLS